MRSEPHKFMILDSFFGGGPKAPPAAKPETPSAPKGNLIVIDPDGDLTAQKPAMRAVAKLLGRTGGRPKKAAITEPQTATNS